jgi:hypothetical protein
MRGSEHLMESGVQGGKLDIEPGEQRCGFILIEW